MEVYRAPGVLVLHIKRFSFSTFRRTKLSTSISFPTSGLDLSPFCSDSSPDLAAARAGRCSLMYDLVGVSNHSGGLGGGHYTADVLNQDDGNWYRANDSRVSPTSASHLNGSNAYLLFYQRRK
jgi:ubiquitin C-terminal hydrolase